MRVTVLGGAGFVGSRIVARCVRAGHAVLAVDGLVERTGGRRAHLDAVRDQVEVIERRVEDVGDLAARLARTDVVIDCMGWTRHRAALADPLHDLALNLGAHVDWLRRLPAEARPRIVYLGSRTQFTDPPGGGDIAEDAPPSPADVQGIHKAAAEEHVRLAARLRGLEVIALRFPACVGPHQPADGDEIGLVGEFVRELRAGRCVRVYGEHRRRALVFVDDVAEVVCRLLDVPVDGFTAFNLRGDVLPIAELARRLQALVGRGTVEVADVPTEIAAIDSGAAALAEDRLQAALGTVPRTALDAALRAAVGWLDTVLP
jgi:nucleoside-diphosphate-sugar epimerase